MSGIDSIFIRELDKSSGGFVYKDTITASELHLVDEILTLAGGEDRLAGLWAGRTYQIIIPGRQQSLLITDISFEGDTTVYFVADDDCQVSSSRFMNEPKSFQVNGVRQESRIIRLSY